MSNANAGYLFYKVNFDQNVPGKLETKVNANIEATKLIPIKLEQKPKGHATFPLVTTYPGLLTGTGYTHDAKDEKDAYKIGFFFDHTTGMPVIPGSSVKGTLRSLFPNQFRRKEMKNAWEAYSGPRYQFIATVLKSLVAWPDALTQENMKDLIDDFESEIFDGLVKVEEKGIVNRKPQSLYQRDIFMDAIPLEIVAENNGKDRRLFSNDYLTPHLHKDREKADLDPFTEPRPLQFLKVMPKVKYEFHFILHKSKVIPELSPEKKQKLFEMLLCFHGIGAKTNVGYGQFETPMGLLDVFGVQEENPVIEESMPAFSVQEAKKPTEPQLYTDKIQQGKPLQAMVIDPAQKKVRIFLPTGQIDVPMARLANWPEKGTVVKAAISEIRNGVIHQVSYYGPV